jgi:hypothetical protein
MQYINLLMYNTQFKVKYNDIEQELIHKLKNKTPEEYAENSDEEHEYSSQDVIDICNKLYRDELLSVFNSDNLIDDKIDKGMIYVYDIMMKNESFKEMITEMENICTDTFLKNEELNVEKLESLRQLFLISLFSQHMFYITHKCVCQQIEIGLIDNDLLVELRKHSVDLLKNQFGV